MSRVPLALQVWGANTNVGKTLACAALARAHCRRQPAQLCMYLKPLQTGYPEDHDARRVFELCAERPGGDGLFGERRARLDALDWGTDAPRLLCRTMKAWSLARSPQEAARDAGAQPPMQHPAVEAGSPPVPGAAHAEEGAVLSAVASLLRTTPHRLALVETAGGVLSPVTASGMLQADWYRPLRLPALLVGDSRLGGVSATLAAYESLRARGYSVPAVAFCASESLDDARNAEAVRQHLAEAETPAVVPRLWVGRPDAAADTAAEQLLQSLEAWWRQQQREWEHMRQEAPRRLWWPFTQHGWRESGERRAVTTVIDSAYGDYFTVPANTSSTPDCTATTALLDGCGSWWTQSAGHGNVELVQAASHALGRYGHVMFPECVHRPAFALATRLLEGVGRGWASRVFYSDDGSTAVEVALKMAFRLALARGVWHQGAHPQPLVVALNGAYHGDTLGAMDCAPASEFNALQTPWYRARGLFLDPPLANVRDGAWTPGDPRALSRGETSAVAEHRKRIEAALARAPEGSIAALVLEPLLQGAGGMRLVDPRYQQALIDACRARRIPVVFDEVFTGFWRLGAETGAALLQREPDVAAYGKLLTGGALPLAVTLASDEVFTAFRGPEKRQALLHGHSYSAHPAGCATALASLDLYARVPERLQLQFDEVTVRALSLCRGVHQVRAIGSVLAVELEEGGEVREDTQGGAYRHAVDRVAEYAADRHRLFLRALGSAVYIMASPAHTSEAERRRMAEALLDTIQNVM
ncbi:hypothetical protein CDCA_CDCA18G4600 [Cyanidium caldarium]|uniref:Uncharacterized protein n=1 Tax=Cyanidium caldarium TaxID=2771 RepID=A0AAV9J2M5_CYACA|nr:hypothetical protein CDCA_CDCA18G4600 [Cyanidium caldarium]